LNLALSSQQSMLVLQFMNDFCDKVVKLVQFEIIKWQY